MKPRIHRGATTERFPAYGVFCRAALPELPVESPPFGANWVYLDPGQATTLHSHFEREVWFISEGAGVLGLHGEEHPIEAGDTVWVPSFSWHVVKNNGRGPLTLLSVYWADEAALLESDRGVREPSRVLVTAAPPTPNGALHLGHLAGPYLTADVLRRALRAMGTTAAYATGTDDNQSFVVAAGRRRGESGEATADHFAGLVEAGLDAANASPDHFVRPRASEPHVRWAHRLFDALRTSGAIVPRTELCPYSPVSGAYLYEATAAGRCRHCKSEAYGNVCETCSWPNDCRDLEGIRCAESGRPAELRPTTRWVFDLAPWMSELEGWAAGASMRPRLRSFVEDVLANPPSIAVTHPSEWGIEVPVPGYENQRLFVWFEMAARYLAYAETISGGRVEAYFRDPEALIVQCFGMDNAFYYAAFLPALFKAYDRSFEPPRVLVSNEFYRLGDDKFSTSRGNAIWLNEYFDRQPPDLVRMHLARTAPDFSATTFVESDLDRETRTLFRRYHALARTVIDDIASLADGCAPDPGAWTDAQRFHHRRLLERWDALLEAYAPPQFALSRAAKRVEDLLADAEALVLELTETKKPSRRDDIRRTTVALELLALKLLALATEPLAPDVSRRLQAELGELRPAGNKWAATPTFIAAGRVITRGRSISDALTALAYLGGMSSSAAGEPLPATRISSPEPATCPPT